MKYGVLVTAFLTAHLVGLAGPAWAAEGQGCAVQDYVPDEAHAEYEIFLPVTEERALELVTDSMRGIGFVRKKDKKGQMRAARRNTNVGGKSFGNEQLFVSFSATSTEGVEGTTVNALSKKTVAVFKDRQEIYTKAILDQAGCLHALFEGLSAPPHDNERTLAGTLPAATPVRLVLHRFLYSDDVEPGDEIELLVAEDVSVDGAVVIARGARAVGIIADAKKSGGFSVDAKLAFVIREAYAVNGTVIPLEFESGEVSEDWRWSGVGGTVLSSGLIGGLLMRGNAAGVRAGSELVAAVANDVSLD